MRKIFLLLIPLVLGLAVLATAAAASCNITDDTYIWSSGTLAANETPCFVNDSGVEGIVIINGTGVSVTCDPALNLTGSGAGGIVIMGSSSSLSGCRAAGYTSDVKTAASSSLNTLRWLETSSAELWGNDNILRDSTVDTIKVSYFNNIIRNATSGSISMNGDVNNTLVENSTIDGSGIGIVPGGGTMGAPRIINNTIRLGAGANGVYIKCGLGCIPGVIKDNDIAAKTGSPGTVCVHFELGTAGFLIANNTFACDTDIWASPYGGKNNNITGNEFKGTGAFVFRKTSKDYGACGNRIWDNRFWSGHPFQDAKPSTGCLPNVFNITPQAGTNILGGSWIAGNWWWDYPGEDLDGDEIGDTDLPFYNDSAPLLLSPTTYEDCNLSNLTVNAGETVNVRRCTISGQINLTGYGRLYVNDSNVASVNSEANSVLRLYNVSSSGTAGLSGTVYITNSSLGDTTLSGTVYITNSSLGSTTISGPATITNGDLGATTISGAANITGLTAPSLSLSGTGSSGSGLNVTGALTLNGNNNDVIGDFGSISLSGNNNNISGTTGSFSIMGNGNIIRGMSLNNPQVQGSNTIRDSTITGGVRITANNASLINNSISGLDSCMGWIPSGICLTGTGGTGVRITNNTISINYSGSMHGIDGSVFTMLDNAEIVGNNFTVRASIGSECMYLKGSYSDISRNRLDCELGISDSVFYMKEGTGSRIEQNWVTGHGISKSKCVELYQYTDSNVSSNTLVECDFGAYLEGGATGNRFWNNYFHNPGGMGGPNVTANTWNVTRVAGTNIVGGPYIAGNWWWNYPGEDLDGDGIGDTDLPQNLDAAPLLAPPEVWEDCVLNTSIAVDVGRALYIRNCTLGLSNVSIADYGRLYIEDSTLTAASPSWDLSSGIQARLNISGSSLGNCDLALTNKRLTVNRGTFTNCSLRTDGGAVEVVDSNWTDGRVNVTGASSAVLERLNIAWNGTGLWLYESSNGVLRDVTVSVIDSTNGANWSVSGLKLDELWWGANNSDLSDSTVSNVVRLTGGHNELSGLTARGIKFTGGYNNVTHSNFSDGVDFGWSYGPDNMLAHSTLGGNIITMTQSPGREPLHIINNTIAFDAGRSADLEGNSFGITLHGGIHTLMELDNSEIVNNTIFSVNGNSWCVHMKGSDNIVRGNDLRCVNDLRLGYDTPAKRNNITRNRFGGKEGIRLQHNETGDNRIWDNHFESTTNAGTASGANLNASYWNTTKTNASELNMTNIIGGPYIAGNWWSDYGGVDQDGDGIGDTSIPHKGEGPEWQDDWLPLTNARPQQGDNPSGGWVGANQSGEEDDEEDDDEDDYDETGHGCEDGCSEGEKEEFSLTKTAVVQIVITPARDVQNVKIHIKRLPEKPAETDNLHGAVYQYLKIDKSASDEEIAEASIKFAIDNDWLATNNYDPDSVKLKRWHGGFWVTLPTTKENSDEQKTYYLAATPGLSYFAVVVDVPEATIEPTKTETGPTGAFIFGEGTVVGAGIIIVAFGLVLLRRGRKSPRRAAWRASLRSSKGRGRRR